jgi:hypothetical protein
LCGERERENGREMTENTGERWESWLINPTSHSAVCCWKISTHYNTEWNGKVKLDCSSPHPPDVYYPLPSSHTQAHSLTVPCHLREQTAFCNALYFLLPFFFFISVLYFHSTSSHPSFLPSLTFKSLSFSYLWKHKHCFYFFVFILFIYFLSFLLALNTNDSPSPPRLHRRPSSPGWHAINHSISPLFPSLSPSISSLLPPSLPASSCQEVFLIKDSYLSLGSFSKGAFCQTHRASLSAPPLTRGD